jgi:transposase
LLAAVLAVQDVAKELHLDWHAVKDLEKQYMRAQLARVGSPGPKAIGIDEISIRKGHDYRIVVSDLIRERPIWFGGKDRKEASMALFYDWLGDKKTRGIRLVVMDMWKPFRTVTVARAPQAAILYDKFHIMRHLGDALDEVRKSEYRRVSGQDRSYIKGQKYTLLSRRENLTLKGRQALNTANKRLNTEYLLRESSKPHFLQAAVTFPFSRILEGDEGPSVRLTGWGMRTDAARYLIQLGLREFTKSRPLSKRR